MKKLQYGIAATAFAIFGCAAIPAQAMETLDLSYAAASTVNEDTCWAPSDYGVTPLAASGLCQVVFPVSVPAGHTIYQIRLLYGTFCPQAPFCWSNDLYTAAYLADVPLSGGGPETRFFFSSTIPVQPSGAVKVANLMAQPVFPKNTFPEAFVVQADRIYHVTVQVNDVAMVYGIQVLFD